MGSSACQNSVTAAGEFTEYWSVVVGESFGGDPKLAAVDRRKSFEVVPCVFAALRIVSGSRFHVQNGVANFDRFELFVKWTAECWGPTAGPNFFTVDGPATHLAAGVAKPNVLAISDRGWATGAAETIGVDALCLRIAGEFALPEGVAVVCINAVQHDVGTFFRFRGLLRGNRFHGRQE